jgi:hypothetical protein
MNDLLSLAAAVRERYLEALLESLATFMDENDPAMPEAMFELQRDDALPFRLYRADMATVLDGTPKALDTTPATQIRFDPFGIDLGGGVTVAVSPFLWSELAVQTNVVLPAEPVEQWALRWLDLEGAFSEDEHGLKGVIHAVTRDDGTDGGTLLTVDFGSAPVDALAELMEIALASGASHVSVRSEALQ